LPEIRSALLACVLALLWIGRAAAGEPALTPSPLPVGEGPGVRAPAAPTAPTAPAVPETPKGPAPKESGKPPEKSKTTTEEIQFYAVQQQLLRKEQAAFLSGSAWVASRGVLIEAEHIVVWEKQRQIYGQGGVRLTEAGGRLLADEIFYDFGTERGRATGVRLEIGKVEEVPGELSTPGELPKIGAGTFGAASSSTPSKWYLTAPEVRRAGPGSWQMIKPRVSSCDFAEPHWCFAATSADYYPGRKVQSYNNVIYLGPVPVFYLPYMARDLSHDYPWTTWQLGKSSKWGYYGLSKWGLDLPHEPSWVVQPQHLKLDADYRQERGWAYGGSIEYDVLPHGRGTFDSYFLREDQISAHDDRERAEDEIERRTLVYQNLRTFGAPKVIGHPKRLFDENLFFVERRTRDGYDPPDLDPDRYAEEQRFALHWVHRQDFLPERNALHDETVYNLDVTVELFDYSDRDFRREYFRNEYRHEPEPLTSAVIRHQGDAGSLWLAVEPRTDPFTTQTERLPELHYDLVPQRLPGGFFASSSADLGYLRHRFDEDSGFEDFEAGRGHMQLVVSRPVNLGPVGFTPYVGTDQTWYSRSREEDDLVRGAALYGADSSVRLYGTYDAENDLLNIHGLRHVVEPRLFFRGVSEPTQDAVNILDFDPVDDLAKSNVVGAALSQKLQTKRRGADGSEHVSDLAGINFVASGFVDGDEADRLNEGDKMLPYRVSAFVSPIDHLTVSSSAEIDAHGIGLARYTEGVSYERPGLFKTSLGYTTVVADPDHEIKSSQYLTGSVETRLGPNWLLQASSSYEFERPNAELGEHGYGGGRFALIRSFHCWYLCLDYSIGNLKNDERDRTFGVTITAVSRPANLVKGSDQLLFESPESGLAPWFFPPAEPAGELRVVPPEEPPKR
jgi:hypothetical protein